MKYLALFALIAGIALFGLSLAALIRPSFAFWPPPREGGWQRWAFFVLFRSLVYGAVAASIWHLWLSGIEVSPARFWIAIILIGLGFAGAFWATFGLGWRNAFGAKEGLRMEGAFAHSRNPVYVATWFGLAGWGLLISDTSMQLALACWAGIYLVAIFLEERWLLREYGEAFSDYCSKVRRFL